MSGVDRKLFASNDEMDRKPLAIEDASYNVQLLNSSITLRSLFTVR